MPTVRINTSDTDWLARHAPEAEVIPYGTDTAGVMYFQADIQVPSVEHVTFAGAAMIRFSLTDRPADHARPGAMYPATYLVAG